MTHDEFLHTLKALADTWCERRALRPLHRFLGGYLALNGLTDGYADLEVALQDVLAFGKGDFTEEERAEIKRLLIHTRAIVYRK
jgi:hypothetical protein